MGVEGSFYIADRIEIGENFVLNLGAQLALYSALGPAIQRNYLPGVPKSDLSVTDIQTYQDNEGFAQKVSLTIVYRGVINSVQIRPLNLRQ